MRYRSFPWKTIEVRGPDAATWLNGVLTCDALQLAKGGGVWGLLLAKSGKIQAELLLLGTLDHVFLGVVGGEAQEVIDTLEKYLVMEDAELELGMGLGWALVEERAGPAGDLFEFVGPCPWDARGTWLCGVGRSPNGELEAGLAANGAALSTSQWDALRQELGLPLFGVDYGPSDNPHEAALERRAVDWKKGCYLGQEVVCMQDMRGKVKRRVTTLQLPAGESWPGDIEPRDVVSLEDGTRVGEVTSWSGGRAMARLNAPAYEPGTELSVAGQRAVVSALGTRPAG